MENNNESTLPGADDGVLNVAVIHMDADSVARISSDAVRAEVKREFGLEVAAIKPNMETLGLDILCYIPDDKVDEIAARAYATDMVPMPSALVVPTDGQEQASLN